MKSLYDFSPTSDQVCPYCWLDTNILSVFFLIIQIELALKIWSVTSKNCQKIVSQVSNETIQDNNNKVRNGELKLLPKHFEQQNQYFSLKLWAPSTAGIIEARQTNIK